MKLTQYNSRIFREELAALNEQVGTTISAIDAWLKDQKDRETGLAPSQYAAQGRRMRLENQLNDLREKLATVYDFQGDRGMADFVPAGFTPLEIEDVEVDEGDDPEDWCNLDLGFAWGNEVPEPELPPFDAVIELEGGDKLLIDHKTQEEVATTEIDYTRLYS